MKTQFELRDEPEHSLERDEGGVEPTTTSEDVC